MKLFCGIIILGSAFGLGLTVSLLPTSNINLPISNINLATSTFTTSSRSTTSSSSGSVAYTLALVKEMKTWEEAVQHCRVLNGSALAVLSSYLQLFTPEVESAQTENVWVGLHHLDNKWLWMNEGKVNSLVPVPPCPVPDYRCGACNINTHTCGNRHCGEKLNFLCYPRVPQTQSSKA